MSKQVKVSVILVFGELLKVESKLNDDKEMVHRMFFKTMVYDNGLEEEVPKSIGVKLTPEHIDLLDEYKSKVGKIIAVPVVFSSMNGNTYYRTSGDGKMLNLVEQGKPVQPSITS